MWRFSLMSDDLNILLNRMGNYFLADVHVCSEQIGGIKHGKRKYSDKCGHSIYIGFGQNRRRRCARFQTGRWTSTGHADTRPFGDFYILGSIGLIVGVVAIIVTFATKDAQSGIIGGSLLVPSLLLFALGSIVNSLKSDLSLNKDQVIGTVIKMFAVLFAFVFAASIREHRREQTRTTHYRNLW